MIESGRTFGSSICDSPICVLLHDARTLLSTVSTIPPRMWRSFFTDTDRRTPFKGPCSMYVVYAHQTSAESLGNIGQMNHHSSIHSFRFRCPHTSRLTPHPPAHTSHQRTSRVAHLRDQRDQRAARHHTTLHHRFISLPTGSLCASRGHVFARLVAPLNLDTK